MPNKEIVSAQLDPAAQSRIDDLCAEGQALAREHQYDAAIVRYCEAFGLLPMPVERWPAANSILSALADIHFKQGDYKSAGEMLMKAMQTPGAIQNPFIRLRRGQVALETGHLDRAEQEMAAAYMLEGEKIFRREDPKYFVFLQSKLFPPEAAD